jgi:hypothetical protein
MNRNRLAGFGFVLFGLSQLSSILTAGSIEDITFFNLLMAVGGLSLAGIGARMIHRGDTSETKSVSSRQTGAVVALAAISLFIGGFTFFFIE